MLEHCLKTPANVARTRFKFGHGYSTRHASCLFDPQPLIAAVFGAAASAFRLGWDVLASF